MDKEEYFEIVSDIRDAHRVGDMESVVRFSEELDLSKVKEASVLEMISDAYYAQGDIPTARDMLLDAYDLTAKGRSIAYKLASLCIETGNLKDAVGFYSDFCRIAPNDNRKYILKYEIAKAGDVDSEELIKILEEYVSLELDDKYMYELAKLYHEQGMDDKCVDMCDSLSIWYSDGDYVEKSLQLKQQFAELTPAQQEVYDAAALKNKELQAPAEEPEDKAPADISEDKNEDIKQEKPESVFMTLDEPSPEEEDAASDAEPSVSEEDDSSEALQSPEESNYENAQLTIDEVFAKYAHKLEDNKEEAENRDAERLQRIREAVESTMPPAPQIEEDEDEDEVDIKIYEPEKSPEDIEEEVRSNYVEEDETDSGVYEDETEALAAETSYFDIDDDDDFFEDYGSDDNASAEEADAKEDVSPKDESAGAEASKEEPSADTEIPGEEPSVEADVPKDEGFAEGEAAKAENSADDEEYLSDEMCAEVSEYLMIEGMEDQLTEAISDIVNARAAGRRSGGNLIVSGEAKSGKTYLTLAIIKEINRKTGGGAGRVAKIQAESLNGKDISKVLAKVAGNDLVIENVGMLDDDTMLNLIEVLQNEDPDSMISIEDNPLAIESLISTFPEIEDLFVNRVNIHELNMTQWAEVACDYAAERGYMVGDIALLALHTKIDEKNVASTRFGMDDVIDIIEEAIYNAEGRGAAKRRGRKKRGLIELIETDFA